MKVHMYMTMEGLKRYNDGQLTIGYSQKQEEPSIHVEFPMSEIKEIIEFGSFYGFRVRKYIEPPDWDVRM